MVIKIKLRSDTATMWESANPVLALGEPAFEKDTYKMKIGDGINSYNELPYFTTAGNNSVFSLPLAELVDTTITADGTEQVLIQYTVTTPTYICGWIDLSDMVSGDMTIIRMKINDKIHSMETYSGALASPMVYIDKRAVGSGDTYTVTLQQSNGTNRTFGYQFFGE